MGLVTVSCKRGEQPRGSKDFGALVPCSPMHTLVKNHMFQRGCIGF